MDTGNADTTAPTTFLEPDREVPGQKFVCLSFISPERVLARKDAYFFAEFVKDVEVQHKIGATEKFLQAQMAKVEARLSAAQDALQVATEVEDSRAAAEAALKEVAAVRSDVSRVVAADLEAFVKANMTAFRTTDIEEKYAAFMTVHRERLEKEFHAANDFRTTVRGLKVRGTYDTYAEAAARAKALQKGDPAFSVYVGQVGFWLPWDPEPSEVANQEYAEEQLNTLMQKYKENEAKRDEFFEEDKRQKVAAARAAAKRVSDEAAAARAAAAAAAASNAAASNAVASSNAAASSSNAAASSSSSDAAATSSDVLPGGNTLPEGTASMFEGGAADEVMRRKAGDAPA